MPAACLVAFTTVLAGCGPENGEPIIPSLHNASLGGGGQLISMPITDLRHHQRIAHSPVIRRHPSHAYGSFDAGRAE